MQILLFGEIFEQLEISKIQKMDTPKSLKRFESLRKPKLLSIQPYWGQVSEQIDFSYRWRIWPILSPISSRSQKNHQELITVTDTIFSDFSLFPWNFQWRCFRTFVRFIGQLVFVEVWLTFAFFMCPGYCFQWMIHVKSPRHFSRYY